MPWKESRVVDERLKFIAEVLKGEEFPLSSIGRLGISKLSIKGMRPGFTHERIEPGKPTQNGRHERLHRLCKRTAISPAETLAPQRERSARFTKTFNHNRPHQALGMHTPALHISSSSRKYPAALDYSTDDERHVVRHAA